jgi:hypothetical protein
MSMPEIVKRTIQQAIKLLDASGAKYKIIDQDGNEFGTLTASIPKKTNKNYAHPPGTMFRYYHPLVKNMQVGDVVVIDSGEFTPKSLQGALTGWATAQWGKGSYKTCIIESNIEILRCA